MPTFLALRSEVVLTLLFSHMPQFAPVIATVILVCPFSLDHQTLGSDSELSGIGWKWPQIPQLLLEKKVCEGEEPVKSVGAEDD